MAHQGAVDLLAGKLPIVLFGHLRRPAAWLAVLVFAGTLGLWLAGIPATFDPPYLILALNFIFIGIASVPVAAIGTRAFLRSGSRPVLLLGAGALTFAAGTLVSAWALAAAGVNAGVTVHNSIALFAAALHALGACYVLSRIAPRSRRAGRLSTVLQLYLGSLAAILLVIVAGLRGVLPPFFIEGTGGTPLRQMVLGLTMLLFFGAGLVYLQEYARSRSAFLYWYALGLLLTSLGMAGILMQSATGTPLNWMGRAAQLLGGVYLLVAALVTVGEARARNLPPGELLASFFWHDEAHLKRLFESIMDPILVTDQDFVITDWNQAAEATYGWKADEVVGKRVSEVLSTTYASEMDQKQALEVLLNIGTWKGEVLQRHRDGRGIPVLATVSGLQDAAGRAVGAVAVNRDITERKRAETLAQERANAIARQNAVLNGINRILQCAITTEDEEALGIACLEVAEEVTQSKFGFVGEINEETGRLDAIAISDPGWEACQADDSANTSSLLPGGFAIHGIYGGVLRDGKGFFTNDPASHPDQVGTPPGHPPLTAFLGVPLVRGGKTIGMVGLGNREGGYSDETLAEIETLAPSIVQTIFFRRASEELRRAHDELDQRVRRRTAELAHANELLRYEATVLENVNDAVVACDAALRITAWNRAAEEQYGWKAEEVMGAYMPQVVGAQLTAEERAAILASVAQAGRWQGEVRHVRRDGTPILVESTSVGLRDAAGRIYAYVIVNRDITERKRAEEELRAGREQMQVLSHRLIEAVENERRAIGRELHDHSNQLLVSLMLGLALLDKRYKGSDEARGHIAYLQQIADELSKGLHDLAVSLRPASLDRVGLVPALLQLRQMLESQAATHIDLITTGLEERLGPDLETAIFRVVQESLTNVVRHAEASRAGVIVQQHEGFVTAIIEDDGKGFDADAAWRSGRLGLTGMRERVEMLGGQLTIETRPGGGTTVFAQLPCTAREALPA